MSEMVKRVGAAILLAQAQWNAKTAKEPLEVVVGRAAIEAMREPTMEMLSAGNDEIRDVVEMDGTDSMGYGAVFAPSGALTVLGAMIDEALKP